MTRNFRRHFHSHNAKSQTRLEGVPLASFTSPSLEAGFGFLQYFTHPNRQTVHDRIAETVVIVDRRPGGETVES